jgi:hypothetical protein
MKFFLVEKVINVLSFLSFHQLDFSIYSHLQAIKSSKSYDPILL